MAAALSTCIREQCLVRKWLGCLATVLLLMSRQVVLVNAKLKAAKDATGISSYGLQCPKAIFSFADSLSDAGVLVKLFPNVDAAHSPYGSTFPGYPTGRWNDGRNIIDFLALGLGLPTLNHFADNINPKFNQGVNFATAGATARCDSLDSLHVPFCLPAQVDQAIAFKRQALAASHAHVPKLTSFSKKGLYFVFIGGNDIHYALGAGLPVATITDLILPELVSNISTSIARLYASTGARQFLVGNIPPIGCSPFSRTVLYKPQYGPPDAYGCLAGVNRVVDTANSLLVGAVQRLRETLEGAVILHANVHDIILELTTRYKAFGFTEPVDACCGSAKGLHYLDWSKRCGTPEADHRCDDPSRHIFWDGVHFTDAVNRLVANATLTGEILDPPVDLVALCGPR